MLSVNDNNVVLNLANFYLQDTKMTFMLPGERKDLNDGIFIFPTSLQSIKHKEGGGASVVVNYITTLRVSTFNLELNRSFLETEGNNIETWRVLSSDL